MNKFKTALSFLIINYNVKINCNDKVNEYNDTVLNIALAISNAIFSIYRLNRYKYPALKEKIATIFDEIKKALELKDQND